MAYVKMQPYKLNANAKTVTVILDLNNPDPTTWATYADDAVGMTAGSDAWDTFFGHYPCILENGVELGKLKRNNFAQYEDGTSAPITTLGKDVMICFPRRGIKIEYTDSSHLSVSMTDEEGKSGYSYMGHSYKGNACDRIYYGVYKGYGSGSKLYSVSGKTPTVSQKLSTFRSWAQAKGSGYELGAWFQLIFRQVAYLLKYKGQNAQVAIGRGFVDGNSSAHTTGGTNLSGMDYGEATGKIQCKLFGIEDAWGNIYEFVDGVIRDSSSTLWVSDGNYNDSASGYISAGLVTGSSNTEGYLRVPIGNNYSGFLAKYNENYGSSSTYFCDMNYLYSANARVMLYGGRFVNGDEAGLFMILLNNMDQSEISINYGSRLMYMHVA